MTFNSKTLAKAFAAAVVAGAMLAPVAASAGTVENLERRVGALEDIAHGIVSSPRTQHARQS